MTGEGRAQTHRTRLGWAGPPVLADAWFHAVSCHPEPTLSAVDQVLAQAAATHDRRLAAEADMVAAIGYINVGDAARCLARVTRALESTDTADDAGFRGWATTLAGAALMLLERPDEGLETLAQAEMLLAETRVADPRVVHAYGNIGLCRSRAQLFDTADESYAYALEIGRALDLPPGPSLLGRAENRLFWGMRLEHIGDLASARERYGQATRTFARAMAQPSPAVLDSEQDLAVVGAALAGSRPLTEGGSADPAGDLENARGAAARSLQPETTQWLAHATAAVRLRLGDPEGALAAVEHTTATPRGLWQPLATDRFFTAAACYHARGDAASAFEVYRAFHRYSDEAGYASQQQRGAAALDRVSRARTAAEYEERARGAALDPLTGIANRPRLDTRLGELVSAAGPGRPLTVAVVDVDGMHAVNAAYGRHTGDEVLRAVASMLDRDTAPHDLAARLGGDEFALLCPGLANGTALLLRDAVSSSVSSYPWEVLLAPGLRVTVSVGLASWSPGTRPEDLVDRAYADLDGRDLADAPPVGAQGQASLDARTAS